MRQMNLYKQAKAFFLRNKVSNFEYDCVKAEIYSTNRNLLNVCSFVASLLFFLLAISSFLVGDEVVLKGHLPYVLAFVLMFGVFIASLKLPDSKNRVITVLVYIFYTEMAMYSIYSGIFAKPHNFAVVYLVFEFGFPLIFVDKTKRIFLFSFIMNVIYGICTVVVKNPENYRVDIFNAIVFYLLSFLPSFYLTKVRIREFSLRQLIESERDTDALTGLLNKGAFTREAKKSIGSSKNGILIILDLDFFKAINDTYGHFVGDNVLKLVSGCIMQTFRSSDVMGRFGGDEFVILMAKTENLEMAMVRCNQLLEKLNSTKIFPNDPSNQTTIHASMGFALYKDDPDFESLFKNADSALYEAKNNGKDRACQFMR